MADETSLVDLSKEETKDFMATVKQRYLDGFADEAIQLMKDWKLIQKSHAVYGEWVKRLEEGDIKVLEEFKKKRHRLEVEDDFEL